MDLHPVSVRRDWPGSFLIPLFRSVLIGCLALPSLPPVAAAQEEAMPGQAQPNLPPVVLADQTEFTLAFDHATGSIELRNHRGVVQDRWETRGVARPTAPLALIPPNRPLAVVIENANSLLYQYEVSVDVIGQKDVRTCSDIGGQFAARAFMVSVGALQGVMSPPPPNFSLGFDQPFFDFQAMGASRGIGEAGAGTNLTVESLERSLVRVRGEILSYLEFTTRVNELSANLPQRLRTVALLGESQPIDSLLADLQASIEAVAPGLSDPSAVARVLRSRSEGITTSAHTLETLWGQVANGRYAGSYQDPGAVELRDLRSRLQANAGALIDTHRTLQEHLLRIETARARSTQGFAAGPSRGTYRRVTIRLDAAPEPESTSGIRTGELMVYTEPHVATTCHFSFGFGIMERPIEYDVFGGELVEVTQDDLRTAANVLFHFGPTALPVSLMLGAGFGIERAPDLILGGTVRFFHPVYLNAGVVWQRQRSLGGIMAVGATVPLSFRVEDLDMKYRSALFLGLSISP